MAESLHHDDPTHRFSNRTEDYVKYRPSYPAAAIDAILHGLGDPSRLAAADIGAGTGISSRLLADRGVHVIAVEPNAQMRAAAAPHPLVTMRDGSAEHTGLDTASVHLLVCAQSFHWFNPPPTLTEFHRILKPDGRAALMWNDRDDSDPLTREYGRLILEASDNHPAARHFDHQQPLRDSPLFADYCAVAFPSTQSVDADALIGRARSASYCPKEGAAWERLRSALLALHALHEDAVGHVQLVYQTRVYLARRV